MTSLVVSKQSCVWCTTSFVAYILIGTVLPVRGDCMAVSRCSKGPFAHATRYVDIFGSCSCFWRNQPLSAADVPFSLDLSGPLPEGPFGPFGPLPADAGPGRRDVEGRLPSLGTVEMTGVFVRATVPFRAMSETWYVASVNECQLDSLWEFVAACSRLARPNRGMRAGQRSARTGSSCRFLSCHQTRSGIGTVARPRSVAGKASD